MLPRALCKLYNWANCFGQFLNVPSKKKKDVLLLSKYSQYSLAKTRIIFPSSSVWSIGRKMELFARRKPSSENTIFELSPGFHSARRTFRHSLYRRVLTLWYFSISIFLIFFSSPYFFVGVIWVIFFVVIWFLMALFFIVCGFVFL